MYFSAKDASAIHDGFDETLQQEMDDSDIFLMCINDTVGKSPIEFEYEYAKSTGKAILTYLIRETNTEDTSAAIKKLIQRIGEDETCVIVDDESELPAGIPTDLLKLILDEPISTFWVRSDISSTKVDSIARQKFAVDSNLLQASHYIQSYEGHLGHDQHDQIVGALIDVGLRPNISGQAYRFVVSQTPEDEIKHDQLRYQYCIDRFTAYQGGAVYDRLLDLTWLLIDDQSFSWQDALNWKEKLHSHSLEKVLSFQPVADTNSENWWRLPSIEELMTLITYQKQERDYFDKAVFPGDVHWFWSSTPRKNEQKAYYIETTQGSVLKDELSHFVHNTCLNGT
jgi:hypothetical protein